MVGPIYKLFIIRSFRESYYQLSREERNRFWASLDENEKAAQPKILVGCDARWCNEAYAHWGVMEYPDLQAIQKSTRANEEIQLFRYVESETYLGTKIEGLETSPVDFPNPLYQLFLIKNQDNDLWESLSQDTRDRIFSGVVESIQKHGGKMLIGCDTNWSNEEYAAFGVIAWPNVETEQAHFKDLAKIGWHRYAYAKSILGTKHV